MKHTPGPWAVSITDFEHSATRHEVMRKGYSLVICHVHRKGRANSYNYTLPVEENARLIAAAPEMESLLREQLEAMDNMPMNDINFAGRDWLVRTAALLSKIDGNEVNHV